MTSLPTPSRCPFASADRCPKYLQSLWHASVARSKLGKPTLLSSAESHRLWSKSKDTELWKAANLNPPTFDDDGEEIEHADDDGKTIRGRFQGRQLTAIGAFCPEVANDHLSFMGSDGRRDPTSDNLKEGWSDIADCFRAPARPNVYRLLPGSGLPR